MLPSSSWTHYLDNRVYGCATLLSTGSVVEFSRTCCWTTLRRHTAHVRRNQSWRRGWAVCVGRWTAMCHIQVNRLFFLDRIAYVEQVYRRRYESRRSSKPKLHFFKQKNKIWRKTIFNMVDGILTPCNVARSWNWFRQVTAPCNVACGSGIDSEFTKWQHPAVWYGALGWRAIVFAQTSAILEFYIWFRFRPHYRSRHVILHQSSKFYPNRTLGRKKWRHVDFKNGGSQPSWILGIQ